MRHGWHGIHALTALVQEEYALRLWKDHVADTLDAIAFGLGNMGKSNGASAEDFHPYSEYAHRSMKPKKPEKKMTYKEIALSVIDRM